MIEWFHEGAPVLGPHGDDHRIVLPDGSLFFLRALRGIGKKHALKKYEQFAVNTSCFWGRTGSNITPVVQFHEIFVKK